MTSRPALLASGSPLPSRRPGAERDHRRLDDTGAETAEIVLVLPVLMGLLLLGLQLALWGLAAHAVAFGVAEAGAAARAQPGSPQNAASIVSNDVRATSGSLVGSLETGVQVLPDDFLAVSATGVVPTVFPGLHLRVSAVSTGPAQTFRASG